MLFGLALGVYWLVSVALPLVPGRDLPTYIAVWVQLDQWDSVLPMTMLYRTPVAPIVAIGPLDLFGAWGAQVWMSLLYAASILAWALVASRAGARATVLTSAALLVFPGYVLLFHRLASDAVFAAGFALWALLVARALDRPTPARFALVGLGVAALALIRPGNQVLALVAALPLLVGLPWRRRLACGAVTLAAIVLPLGAWAVNNGVRYDDYAVARGGAAYLPFFRAFTTDHIVDPANGPHSRELAKVVRRDLLPLEPYRSRGIDVETFFAKGQDRLFEDLLNLTDRTWGWDSNYAMLRSVAIESIRAHPGTYLGGVARTFRSLLWRPFQLELRSSATPADATSAPTRPARSRGGPAPEPDGELIPAANQGFYATTPDGRAREIWTSPTEHALVFRNPRDAARSSKLGAAVGSRMSELPAYPGRPAAVHQLSRLSWLWPPALVWLAVGLVALAIRRPKALLVLVLTASALAVVLLNAATIYAIHEFAVPVVPAFVLLAAVGLVGTRGTVRPR